MCEDDFLGYDAYNLLVSMANKIEINRSLTFADFAMGDGFRSVSIETLATVVTMAPCSGVSAI